MSSDSSRECGSPLARVLRATSPLTQRLRSGYQNSVLYTSAWEVTAHPRMVSTRAPMAGQVGPRSFQVQTIPNRTTINDVGASSPVAYLRGTMAELAALFRCLIIGSDPVLGRA